MPVIDVARREAPDVVKSRYGHSGLTNQRRQRWWLTCWCVRDPSQIRPLSGVTGGVQENRPSEVQNVVTTCCEQTFPTHPPWPTEDPQAHSYPKPSNVPQANRTTGLG
jgi:hypothetical protein